MGFLDHVFSQPDWLIAWMLLFTAVSFLSVPFAIKDVRARWILIATLLIVIFGRYLYINFGYTRIIGLSHIVVWSPLLIYLWRNRRKAPERIWTNRYLMSFMVIISICYVVDVIDVVRYFSGDHAIV